MSARRAKRLAAAAGGVAAGVALISGAWGAADQVKLPEGYRDNFVVYTVVDRADNGQVRFMYVNPEALEQAVAGGPLPYGTVIVMENHRAAMVAEGQPQRDANGRMIPTDEIAGIFVQEKQPGFGLDRPEEARNGEWQYAQFAADGTFRADANYDNCFNCHRPQAEEDYTFTFHRFVSDAK